MRLRRFVTVFAVCASVILPLFSQDQVQFFPLSEIRPGLRGVGRTVFEGDKVSEFQVEILGVLKNVMVPKHDIILARLSGSSLEKTGVIAGMSGSPVYVDGKLVGAVALSFPFSKEPITGITPIEEMLSAVPGAPLPPRERPAASLPLRIAPLPGGRSNDWRLLPGEEADTPPWNKIPATGDEEGTFARLRLPLRFGGFPDEVIEAYAPVFRKMGFEPLAVGSVSGGESGGPLGADVGAGSMISLFLLRGDLNLNVDCTVTYRKGGELYACGHRILLAGPAEIPFAQSRVLATVPSLFTSFKLSTPGPPVGSIRQDRFGAIYGVVGDKAPVIPLHIQVDSTLNKRADYQFEMVQETFLSPLLLNLAVVASLMSTERMIGPATFELSGTVRLSQGESVELEDVVAADINALAAAGLAAATPLSYVLASGFPDLRIEAIELAVHARNEKRVANVEQAWSTKSEVRPGDHIEVTAVLRTPWGESVTEKIPVTIPESVSDKTLSLTVGSGAMINALQNRLTPLATAPRDLRQLVRALNRMRRNNRLYALLMAPQRSFILQGDEYPSPPPSLVQTLLADPSVSSSITFGGGSVVGDFEASPSPYAVRGQKTLLLKVANTGN